MSILALSVLCILVAAFFYKRTRPKPVAPTIQRVQDLDQAIAILRDSSLESRAIPNERLVRAFGIDNSFTTTIPEFNREFVTAAHRSLRIDDYDFEKLATEAKAILNERIRKIGGDELVPLTEIVQFFVFRVTLTKFFPDVPPPSDADAVSITRNINIRWLGSKDSATSFSPTQIRSQRALDSALRRVFHLHGDPEVPIEPHSNPLNMLLPVYEALWQVVLSGFLQVGVHSPFSYEKLCGRHLGEFLDDPTRAAFEDSTNHTSIRHIVAEILRLYPPTKRIKRFHDGQLYDIDVEYLQRDVDIWGGDADVFEPERWNEKTETQESAYMPFGSGKFICPSRRVAGPMLIGMLVSVLVGGLEDAFEVVGEDGEPVVFGNVSLDSGRSAHAGLRLKRRRYY
jgi:hypothetical protein